jgi:hypothetical protein
MRYFIISPQAGRVISMWMCEDNKHHLHYKIRQSTVFEIDSETYSLPTKHIFREETDFINPI